MLTDCSLKSRLLACLITTGISFAGVRDAVASDCGCHSCDPVATCSADCACDGSEGVKHNCVYKALDAFAGGIEKLLRLDECGCDESRCDDACDAAVIQDLMLPTPPAYHHNPHAHHSPRAQPVPIQPYSGPTRDIQLSPTGPSQWEGAGRSLAPHAEMRMTAPPTSQGTGQHLGKPLLEAMPAVPLPVRSPEAEGFGDPDADFDTERGSLFDSLSDPFSDDEVRVRPYQTVRPTNYLDGAPRPVSRRPLKRTYAPSSRSDRSVR